MSARVNKDDYIGKKFYRWTVLEVDEKRTKEAQKTYFKCRCECGKKKSVCYANLKNGKTKSCGCYNRELISNLSTTHGMSKTRFYSEWKALRRRCYGKNQKSYVEYGARGIIVCDRWKDSFENFKEDMYESYLNHVAEFGEQNTSIDRIDVNGNYELSNVRWATWEEQANNKRDNHYIFIDGDTKTIAEWADVSGINARAIFKRLGRGWGARDAVFKPLM